jgi:hypothetical protein
LSIRAFELVSWAKAGEEIVKARRARRRGFMEVGSWWVMGRLTVH